MITEQDRPMKTPFEDQRASALGHYREVSAKAHHWSSFVEHAILAYQDPELSQQGEGKGMEDETYQDYIDKMECLIGYLEAISKTHFVGLPLELPDVITEAKQFITDFKYELYKKELLNQPPSNPPEVKENDAELNKFASTLSLASLRDQPKPEKTAEEILDGYPCHNRDGYRVFKEPDIKSAMKEYASQSSGSLRDALEKICYIVCDIKDDKFVDALSQIYILACKTINFKYDEQAKALLNNNTDKKE